jgi:predicted CoA-binding protein
MIELPDFIYNDASQLRQILEKNRRVAIVGLSANWYRPSYFMAKYLLDHGYQVFPVNPRYEEVLGRTCYPDLESLPEPVDVVNCFRRAEEIPALADGAIQIGAKVLWMQLGLYNDEAARKAHAAGLQVVADRCMKIEYARLFGGLNLIGVNTGVISSKRSQHMPH